MSAKQPNSPRAMIFVPGQGAASGAVEVYRDGEAVVVRGDGSGVRQTPFGLVEVAGKFEMRFPSVQAFDWAKARAFERDPVRYTKLVGAFGIDDDARRAPQLPARTRPAPVNALAAAYREEAKSRAPTHPMLDGFLLLPAGSEAE